MLFVSSVAKLVARAYAEDDGAAGTLVHECTASVDTDSHKSVTFPQCH